MRKLLGSLILLFLIFFHIYQQALPVFGSSFILASGALGLGLYFYNRRPYTEIITIILSFLPFIIWGFISGYANLSRGIDPYVFNYTKSQFAWLFSGYLIIYIFYLIYPRGSLFTLLYYIVAAIVIQGIISIAMYQNAAINSFFMSIQMVDELILYKLKDTEGERLIGYGTAFFGAGIIYGAALICMAYIIVKKQFNLLQSILWAAVYAFVFFVGVLSARTTIIGLAASIILAVAILLFGQGGRKGQFLRFIALSAIFGMIGYTLCYVYFPEFADWAFEAFINYSQTGEFTTQSTQGLEEMFVLPQTFNVWLFGQSNMGFWGSDVGYSRLLFFTGLPGTIAFFFYQLMLAKTAFSKNIAVCLFLLTFIGYSLVLNIKGLADLNSFLYLFVFYFLHYKYFIFTPQVLKRGKINSSQLHYAIQSPPSRRRV